MQVRCPHCRYKYDEALRPGKAELLSICPRCGHSFQTDVTEDDIKNDQTPPPVPLTASPAEHIPTEKSVPPEIPDDHDSRGCQDYAKPHTPQIRSNVHDQTGVPNPPEQFPRDNFPPRQKSGMRGLPVIVIIIVAASVIAGFIYGVAGLLARGDDEIQMDTFAGSTAPTAMTISPTGNSTFRFEGNIIGKKKAMPVVMNLVKRGRRINGQYYYVMKGSSTQLSLRGVVDEDGKVAMEEYDAEGNHTGDFFGTLFSDGTFKGTFKSGKKKKMKFELFMN